jgi:hypothetical protein
VTRQWTEKSQLLEQLYGEVIRLQRELIVSTPKEAFSTFSLWDMDGLVLDHYRITKLA